MQFAAQFSELSLSARKKRGGLAIRRIIVIHQCNEFDHLSLGVRYRTDEARLPEIRKSIAVAPESGANGTSNCNWLVGTPHSRRLSRLGQGRLFPLLFPIQRHPASSGSTHRKSKMS